MRSRPAIAIVELGPCWLVVGLLLIGFGTDEMGRTRLPPQTLEVRMDDDLVFTIIRDLISGYANSRGRDPEDPAVLSLVEDACLAHVNGTSVGVVCETARSELQRPPADLIRS